MNSPAVPRPVILVGGFERHNFGDMLMGRVMEVCLRERGLTPVHASLLPADLRALGGAWVHAFADLAPFLTPEVPIVHCGGGTIPTSLRYGLRMDVPPEIPGRIASGLVKEGNPTGLDDRIFAYLTPPREVIRGREHTWNQRFFHAQGTFTPAPGEPALDEGVARVLKDAAWLTARESHSLALLHGIGLSGVSFAEDSGMLVPCLSPGGTANLEMPPPSPSRGGALLLHANGAYLDRNGAAMADALARVAGGFERVEVALAGIAANHDSEASAREFVRQLAERGVKAEYCGDLHADAIVARIRGASCVVSTSLHYRIVALTYGVPRVAAENEKVSTWSADRDPLFPHNVAPAGLPDAIAEALAVSAGTLRETAMAARGAAFSAVSRMTDAVVAAAAAPAARFTPPGTFDPLAPMLPPHPGHALFPALWVSALCARAGGAAESKTEIRKLKEDLKTARAELAAIKKSAAWKLLKPFRRF